MASVIIAQGVLTLTALRSGNGLRQAAGSQGGRHLVAVGGVVMAVGVSSIYSTLSRPHFEGYALVLGSVLILQGLLTLTMFLRLRPETLARN